MGTCHYCRRSIVAGDKQIIHMDGCPHVTPSNKAEFRSGWDDGRSGKIEPCSGHAAYLIGFGEGICALEEGVNGNGHY